MLNSAKIIPADQRKCAISDKNKGVGVGSSGPSQDPPLVYLTCLVIRNVFKTEFART